jgi:hypothetical protein
VRILSESAIELQPVTFGHGGAYGTQAWIDPVASRAKW